jgi:hypothetical protein
MRRAIVWLIVASLASSACFEWRSTVTLRDADHEWTQRQSGTCEDQPRGRYAVRLARDGVAMVKCEDERRELRVGLMILALVPVVVFGTIFAFVGAIH